MEKRVGNIEWEALALWWVYSIFREKAGCPGQRGPTGEPWALLHWDRLGFTEVCVSTTTSACPRVWDFVSQLSNGKRNLATSYQRIRERLSRTVSSRPQLKLKRALTKVESRSCISLTFN